MIILEYYFSMYANISQEKKFGHRELTVTALIMAQRPNGHSSVTARPCITARSRLSHS